MGDPELDPGSIATQGFDDVLTELAPLYCLIQSGKELERMRDLSGLGKCAVLEMGFLILLSDKGSLPLSSTRTEAQGYWLEKKCCRICLQLLWVQVHPGL